MLYIIAFLLLFIALLLLIHVLSNETARDLLGDLIVRVIRWAIRLAIVGAVLFAIILVGVEIFKANPLLVGATKNPYKTGQIGVTHSPNEKEEVLWVGSNLIKSRSWLY